jgi:hypothetical protein
VPDSGQEPLDDPTPRVDGEADLIGVLAIRQVFATGQNQSDRSPDTPAAPLAMEDTLDGEICHIKGQKSGIGAI